MVVLGVDLSGPSNVDDTSLVAFDPEGDRMVLRQHLTAATDAQILSIAGEMTEQSEIVVGLDAPLSYQPGGGDRAADRALRARAVEVGLSSGSVMTPTMTRMAYLTLRGISVARALGTIDADLSIVEVHPGAAMAARGAPVEDVRALKGDADARARLLDWLGTQGLDDLDALTLPTDHDVAAAAAALAAWRWRLGEATFCHRADPPLHPFDVAC